jgi:hypothetical protein
VRKRVFARGRGCVRVSATGVCERVFARGRGRVRVSATGVGERERRGKLRRFRGRGEGSCGVGGVRERERRGELRQRRLGCSREVEEREREGSCGVE